MLDSSVIKQLAVEEAGRIKQSPNRKIYLVDASPRYTDELFSVYPWISERTANIDSSKFGEFDGDSYYIIANDYPCESYDRMITDGVRQESVNVFFFPNKETQFQLDELDRLPGEPLRDIIVFRSGPHASQYVPGMDYDDNARALFEYMVENGYNERWKLVWIVKDPRESDFISNKYANVEFVSWDWSDTEDEELRDRYYENLFLAKFVFFTDAYGFARNCRCDQVRVQLWHGCGYKTRVNFSRCEHRYEYNIVIGEEYRKIHERIYGLRDDQVLITGYPKEDWLFDPCKEWKELFGIPEATKYIFWMPTFRKAKGVLSELDEKGFDGDTGLPIVNTKSQMDELNDLLGNHDTVLVIKLHPFQDRDRINVDDYSNIRMIENKDLYRHRLPINRVLGNADALISDYSSTVVDYLVLDRPVAYTLEDIEEYENSRGFVFDNVRDWFAGKEIWNFDDFLEFVVSVGQGTDPDREKRQDVRGRIHDFGDKRACERVLKVLGITKKV